MKLHNRKTAEGILLTDQYQLTMANLYFRLGLHEQTVQFDHYFREYPDYGGHRAGFCINAGMEWMLDWMDEARFRDEDISYLREQKNGSGGSLFQPDFLEWLSTSFSFEDVSILAIPEGRVVHPLLPLAIVRGPLAVTQILETSLLNHLNYQILIATKASRIHLSSLGRPLLEFGLRRGHAAGANAGTRAALIGGADFSSNVGVSHLLGFTPKGTHAHSMVQVFIANGLTELEAFRAYAQIYPDDCLLLVDTIDTLKSGIPNAITVFSELSETGHEPIGVRIDSGNLGELAVGAAAALAEAGFSKSTIVLSDNLDELAIIGIIKTIRREAPELGMQPGDVTGRLMFGVGTHLITSAGAPSLGGIYKLAAVKKDDKWNPVAKISDSVLKSTIPGAKNVWRIYDRQGMAVGDLIALEGESPSDWRELNLYPVDGNMPVKLNSNEIGEIQPLLEEVYEMGKRVGVKRSISDFREFRIKDLSLLSPPVKDLIEPEAYSVYLSKKLWELKRDLAGGQAQVHRL